MPWLQAPARTSLFSSAGARGSADVSGAHGCGHLALSGERCDVIGWTRSRPTHVRTCHQLVKHSLVLLANLCPGLMRITATRMLHWNSHMM